MKVPSAPFDRPLWENLQQSLLDSKSGDAAHKRTTALERSNAAAVDALEHLRRSPMVARRDIKLVDRVLKRAVQQRDVGQPAWRRFLRAVWRALRLPDKLYAQERRAHAMAQRADSRWCAEDERFTQLIAVALQEGSAPVGPSNAILQRDNQSFFEGYLRKLHKRTKLIPECKARIGEASEVVLQLLRIKRGLGDKFSPDRLTHLLNKAAALCEGGQVAKACGPFTVEEFGLLTHFDTALTRLCKLGDAGLLPEEYTASLRLLKQLQAFAARIKNEIAAGDHANRPGDVAFVDNAQLHRFFDKPMAWRSHGEQVLTGSGAMHAAIALPDGHFAEIFREGYVRKPAELYQKMASTALQLDWERLVVPEGKTALRQFWGPQWATSLQHAFENRINRAATAHELRSLRYDDDLLKVPFRRHRQRQPNDLTRLNTKDPMFCSEFVAKTLAVTLHGLEADLRASADKPLARMLRPLFSEHENFKAVHPGYLARRMRPFSHVVTQASVLHKYIDLRAPSRVSQLLRSASLSWMLTGRRAF